MGLPCGPVLKTSPSNVRGAGLIPGRGAKIIYASWPKDLSIKTETIVINSIKDFKNGLH